MSTLTVARTTLLRATRRPSTWALAALAFFPAAFGAAFGAQGYGALTTGGPLALRLVAPLMVAAMVSGPVGESFENRTVVYWFTRPFPRPQVLVGEALGHAVTAVSAMLLSGALLAVANALTGTADIASLARIPLGLFAETVALVSLAVALGALVPKHPVLVTLGALLFTEGALPTVWEKFAYLSLAYHGSVLSGLPFGFMGGETVMSAPPAAVSLAVLGVYTVAPLALASLVVNDRDLG